MSKESITDITQVSGVKNAVVHRYFIMKEADFVECRAAVKFYLNYYILAFAGVQ